MSTRHHNIPPRASQELFVGVVPSNAVKNPASIVQTSNFPEAFRTTRTRVTVIFDLSGVPGAGTFFVRPSRYLSGTAGRQGQPFSGAALTLCGFADVLANSAAGFPQVFSVEVEGFTELFFDNGMDVDVLGMQLQVETIATPTSEVGS